jgi:hypothetical protein
MGAPPEKVLPTIVRDLQEMKPPFSLDHATQQLWALGEMGPAAGDALGVVSNFQSHPHPQISQAANEALKKMMQPPESGR